MTTRNDYPDPGAELRRRGWAHLTIEELAALLRIEEERWASGITPASIRAAEGLPPVVDGEVQPDDTWPFPTEPAALAGQPLPGRAEAEIVAVAS